MSESIASTYEVLTAAVTLSELHDSTGPWKSLVKYKYKLGA